MFTGPKNINYGLIFSVDFGNTKSFSEDKSLINVSDWTVGSGSTTNYSRNGQIYENERKIDTDPFGNQAIVWECIADNLNDGDGGWNTTPYTPIDKTKMYRFSVWVNRVAQGINGRFYLGCEGFDVSNVDVGVYQRSNGTLTTNPYFWVSNNPPNSQLPTGEWRLVVAHIWPENSGTGSNHVDSGIYNITNGTTKVLSISSDMVWMSANTQTRHRCYLYYNTGADAIQQMAHPRIDLCDGTEPTIEELLGNSPNRAINLISKQENGYLLNTTKYDSAGNGSLIFDGVGGKITIADNSTLDLTTNMSFEFWVKINSSQSNLYPRLIDKNLYLVHITQTPPFTIAQNITTSGGLRQTTTSNIQANQWTHIVSSYDGRYGRFYINGVLKTTTDFGSVLPCSTDNTPITIGGSNSMDRLFNGNIAIAKVYNRTLSDSEILQNYNATKSRFGL